MTFDQFISQYLGKKIDWDGFYGGQCVDLYRQYVNDCLGLPQSPGVGGAAEIWDSASSKYYDFIENDPLAVPNKGDILVWNRRVGGGFGHVSIFIEGDVNSFVSLDQNWPTLDVVTKTKHNYNNVIGWMRSKTQVENDALTECLAQHTELVDKCNKKDQEINNLQQELNKLAGENSKLKKTNGAYDETIEKMEMAIRGLETDLSTKDNCEKDKLIMTMFLKQLCGILEMKPPGEDEEQERMDIFGKIALLLGNDVRKMTKTELFMCLIFGR